MQVFLYEYLTTHTPDLPLHCPTPSEAMTLCFDYKVHCSEPLRAAMDYLPLKEEVSFQMAQPPTAPPTAPCCCSLAISEPWAILQCFNPCIILFSH